MKKFLLAFFSFFLTIIYANECAILDEIAVRTGADKGSQYHYYTKVYSSYFSGIRNKPLKFLEIGIYQGSSVKMWEEYFPYAELHFIDINPSAILYHSTRSHYHFVDQENVAQLNQFISTVGGEFDIILDDGGHTMNMQITSFKTLFPHVKSGGMYIIEDLHTSYWKSFGGHGTQDNPYAGPGSTVYFLEKLVDDLNYVGAVTGKADKEKAPPALQATLSLFRDKIYSIHFYSSVCIIIKK